MYTVYGRKYGERVGYGVVAEPCCRRLIGNCLHFVNAYSVRDGTFGVTADVSADFGTCSAPAPFCSYSPELGFSNSFCPFPFCFIVELESVLDEFGQPPGIQQLL